ncbi:DUF2946 family protein [Novosphingobium sp. M1R2S20]|uniref:DUF2946 family protein n=1 Tax=Novosphingobium rhizovicinum TaxID=3228928 RepID=A0ABV3RD59_9SPHN
MRELRRILLSRRWCALLLLTAALAVKALVPAGFMVSAEAQVLTVSICADASGAHLTREIVIPRQQTSEDRASQHAKSVVCPYAALSMAGTPGADPALLALALAFILALAFAPLPVPELAAPAQLRPPLRGPPIAA